MSDASAAVSAFSDADLSDVPGLDAFVDDDRLTCLWVLLAGQRSAGLSPMTPGEISAVLRDVFGRDIPWQRVQALLRAERGTVSRRRKAGRSAYQLMELGAAALTASVPRVLFLEPANALQQLRDIEDVLSALTGTVRICDPYVDPRSLTFLEACQSAAELRLLTVNVQKATAFKRDLRLLGQQLTAPLHVRVASQGVLHDRYVIHDDGMVLFGTSLNGFGLKQSFVVQLGEDLRSAVLPQFDQVWAASAGYP